MTAKSTDAISSFTNLLDNVPTWKKQISALIKHTAQRNEEFKADYNRLVQQARPKRSKSESLRSIYTGNHDVDPDSASRCSATPTPPDLAEISPLVAGNRYIYAQANRKRKQGTSFRSGASGPVKFRSKQAVVIYYDSQVQEQFEVLVKSFGGCRNNLRKGKVAYTVSKGLQLPALRRGLDNISTSPSRESVNSGFVSRSTPQLASAKDEFDKSTTISNRETNFANTDRELEKCQNLCETAAHQFLRDGDCKIELDTVMSSLDAVSNLARITLDALKHEVDVHEKREETISNAGSIHTASDSTLVEQPSQDHLDLGRKLSPCAGGRAISVPQLTTSTPRTPAMADIEVDDDSDGSSIDIDIRQYRLNNPARLRA